MNRLRLQLLACALALGLAPALPAAHFDFATATIADIDAAFAAGALTSEKLTQLCLARITAYDGKLHAVITLIPPHVPRWAYRNSGAPAP
jgi:hypothetical protein